MKRRLFENYKFVNFQINAAGLVEVALPFPKYRRKTSGACEILLKVPKQITQGNSNCHCGDNYRRNVQKTCTKIDHPVDIIHPTNGDKIKSAIQTY